MRVIVSDPISEEGLRIFKDNNIEVIDANGENIDENFSHVKTANGWIIRSGTILDSKIIEKAENLSVIGRAGVGVDNIDISAATRRGIVVMNTPDANTISAAEHTMALILALSRNVSSGHSGLSKGEWNRHLLIGSELNGKIIGIVGLGKIGREVLKRSKAFNMQILGYDPFIPEDFFRDDELQICDLEYLIKKSDYITLHIPLTNETKNLFNYDNLVKMKKEARIVNVARGGIINECDLSRVLKEKRISGAALDVFEFEPLDNDSPLLSAPNIILTPHLGASTKEAKKGVSISICNQVKNFLINEELDNAINIPFKNFAHLKELAPFLKLSELLGGIHSQISDSPIKKVAINCFGSIDDTKPIGLAFLRSLLQSRVPERVNYINADAVAKELGMEVSINFSTMDSNYSNLISARVSSDEEILIEGSVFDDNLPRLVNIFGYKMEVNPSGTLLFVQNDDVPGVIGKVGTLLGDNKINIAAYLLSREKNKNLAFAVIRLDDSVGAEIIGLLNSIEELKFVRQINLKDY
ncbi:MAG: phosphoglycerate dehydrogenase [Candidatus Marinimicrobia bacterium]|nr:phosphoglycerate dehydrogenase [Candidatus Neomarinimicrobiota bacterium]